MSDLLRRTLDETIKIETVLAGGLWPVSADSSQLESAIINLAVNARDAMPNGGRMTIETDNTSSTRLMLERTRKSSPASTCSWRSLTMAPA